MTLPTPTTENGKPKLPATTLEHTAELEIQTDGLKLDPGDSTRIAAIKRTLELLKTSPYPDPKTVTDVAPVEGPLLRPPTELTTAES
jgi:hypothetical protein